MSVTMPHLPGHLSAADVAFMWGVRVGTVYRLACEQGWARIKYDGRVYYRVSTLPEAPQKRTA